MSYNPDQVRFHADLDNMHIDAIQSFSLTIPRITVYEGMPRLQLFSEPVMVGVLTDLFSIQCVKRHGSESKYKDQLSKICNSVNALKAKHPNCGRVLIDKDLEVMAYSNKGYVDMMINPDYKPVPFSFVNFNDYYRDSSTNYIYWGFGGYLVKSVKTYLLDLTTLITLENLRYKTIQGSDQVRETQSVSLFGFLLHFQTIVKRCPPLRESFANKPIADYHRNVSDIFTKLASAGLVPKYPILVTDKLVDSLTLTDRFVDYMDAYWEIESEQKKTKGKEQDSRQVATRVQTDTIDIIEFFRNPGYFLKQQNNMFIAWTENYSTLASNNLRITSDMINYFFVNKQEKTISVVVQDNLPENTFNTLLQHYVSKFSLYDYKVEFMTSNQLTR